VERIYESKDLEHFKITAPDITVTLQSNKPLLRARGLKNKKIYWKVINGDYDKLSILETIIKSLEKTLGYNKRN
jgi:hypothetical protein